MLNSLLQVTDFARWNKKAYSYARRTFFQVKSFVKRLDFSRGSVIDSVLAIVSIRLRSAKTELSSAGRSFKLYPLWWGTSPFGEAWTP
jgi:hypothetical protein